MLVQLRGTALNGVAEIGASDRQLRISQGCFESSRQSGLARDRCPLRPNDREHQELAIVALQPGQNTCP
jgi:hypothetical protein